MGWGITLSDQLDFRAGNIIRDKERHFIIIKEKIHHEDTVVLSLYKPSIRAPKGMKKK